MIWSENSQTVHCTEIFVLSMLLLFLLNLSLSSSRFWLLERPTELHFNYTYDYLLSRLSNLMYVISLWSPQGVEVLISAKEFPYELWFDTLWSIALCGVWMFHVQSFSKTSNYIHFAIKCFSMIAVPIVTFEPHEENVKRYTSFVALFCNKKGHKIRFFLIFFCYFWVQSCPVVW